MERRAFRIVTPRRLHETHLKSARFGGRLRAFGEQPGHAAPPDGFAGALALASIAIGVRHPEADGVRRALELLRQHFGELSCADHFYEPCPEFGGIRTSVMCTFQLTAGVSIKPGLLHHTIGSSRALVRTHDDDSWTEHFKTSPSVLLDRSRPALASVGTVPEYRDGKVRGGRAAVGGDAELLPRVNEDLSERRGNEIDPV